MNLKSSGRTRGQGYPGKRFIGSMRWIVFPDLSSINRNLRAMTFALASMPILAWAGGDAPPRNDLLETGVFIQIPGPNPILTPGSPGSWDDRILETSDAFKDFGTYYLYYHGASEKHGYRIGVATSTHPLGPFTRHGNKPLIDVGPEGTWDDRATACAMILRQDEKQYYMWYFGTGSLPGDKRSGIGLATAEHPLGPWKKFEGNPLLYESGYVGGVVQVKGRYYLYTEHPIGYRCPDYGPVALFTADKPEGPWKPYADNPVMDVGEWGEWDEAGISEAEVLYHSGVFHMFYGGGKPYDPRILTRESIGYAYSFDGVHWIKYGLNPVVTRELNPNAAAFAEVHTIMEPPFIYLYHTLRYKKPWRPRFEKQFPSVEDLGVQVLVTQRGAGHPEAVQSRYAASEEVFVAGRKDHTTCRLATAVSESCDAPRANRPVHLRQGCH
jgi:hypothetical protein